MNEKAILSSKGPAGSQVFPQPRSSCLLFADHPHYKNIVLTSDERAKNEHESKRRMGWRTIRDTALTSFRPLKNKKPKYSNYSMMFPV